MPADDPDVYDALQKGDTIGMFQVESRAQIAFLPKSKPANFYDIVVQVAIIRPGPVVGNMLHAYLKRRQGIEKVSYPHPTLEPILKRTMGVPLFQEQLLKMAMDIAASPVPKPKSCAVRWDSNAPTAAWSALAITARRHDKNAFRRSSGADSRLHKAFANYGFPKAMPTVLPCSPMRRHISSSTTGMFYRRDAQQYPLGFYSAATLVKDAQRHGLHFLP